MEEVEVGDYTELHNNTLIAKMNSDKKYMILKMGNFLISTAGLGWYILYVLRGIRYAIENDFIPVVDWQNCKLPQYDVNKVGKENIWEKFFEQPFHIGVMEAYASEDYFVIDDIRNLPFRDIIDMEDFVDYYNEKAMKWRKYFQQYIRLKGEVKRNFEEGRKQLQLTGNKMIGVLARGTDYRDLKPVGHCRSISEDDIFQEIDETLRQMTNLDIFLATEDQNIFENFKNRYPKKVVTVNTKRYSNTENETLNMVYKEENGYERDLRYLAALYNISKSSTYICTPCGGSVIASLMREEEGDSYKFLYQGYNRARGIIVGSYLEKQKEEIILMGNKPIMFYALNLMKLLKIEEVDIIISDVLKLEYMKQIGKGEKFGLKINYIVSESYNIVDYMELYIEDIKSSKIIFLYADEFVHGKDTVRDLSYRLNTFDGSYIWGIRNNFSENSESVKVNEKNRIPEKVFSYYKTGNYELMGRYIFDNDLVNIVKQLLAKEKKITLADILNEYVERKKLFFLEYKRGIISLKISNLNILEKADQMINLLEELQGERIGDFMSYDKNSGL